MIPELEEFNLSNDREGAKLTSNKERSTPQTNAQSNFTKQRMKIELSKLLLNFLQTSTGQRYKSMFKANKKCVRVIWFIFFGLSATLCSYMIIQNIAHYFEYEVNTKIRVFTEIPTLFPTISICNINPFVTTNATEFLNKFLRYKSDGSLVYQIDLDLARRQAKNPAFGDESRKSLGLKLEEMIITCMYNDEPCKYDEFEWYYDINHGNCFKFNSGIDRNGNKLPLKYVKKEGNLNGFRAELFVGSHQNSFLTDYYSGLYVFVSNSTILPSYSEGIEVNPGSRTSFSINKIFTHNLAKPYSNCEDTTKSKSVLYKKIVSSNYSYRQRDCLDLCLQKIIIDNCDCYDLYLPNLEETALPCLDEYQIKCLKIKNHDFLEGNIIDKCSSLCPLECDSISYHVSTSFAEFPSRSYAEILKENPVIRAHFSNNIDNITFDLLKEKIVSLNIYLSELKYTKSTELPDHSVIDLIASVGGTLGLFLGISLLSFAQIFETFIYMILVLLQKSKSDDLIKEIS